MLAALDRYVAELDAGGIDDHPGSTSPPPLDVSPLVSLLALALLAVFFLGEVIVVSISPPEGGEPLLTQGNALNLYYLASLAVILCLWRLFSRHRNKHPDSPLWRLERGRGLTLWVFALWFWLRGVRWIIALVLALRSGSWLAGQATAAVAGRFDVAGLDHVEDALGRLFTMALLFVVVWITKALIERRLEETRAA